MARDVDRFVDRLLRRRRPRMFAPTEEDLAVMRTAIDLVAAPPDADRPRDAFVDELRGRLAAQQDAGPADAHSRPGLWRGRRRVLQAGAVAASAFAAGFASDRLLAPGPPDTAAPADTRLTPRSGAWQTVAASTDLPEGVVRAFDLGAVVGFIQRVPGGRLRAVSGVCTHQACRLALNESRDQLVCPCHGATFAVTGEPLHNFRSSHPLPSLPRLAVREHQGHIQVYGPDSASNA